MSPEEVKRMHFRIGVNLGDVVEDKDRIYGEGVNIAARLESLCDGGGVCISGAAFENVENKLDLEFEDLGEHEVKNITKPVIKGLFVIARNSVYTYKGKSVKIKQVAQELGVRYVLEGSVRKAGDKVRINAQLIEATSGHHLWAERYDRDLNNIFALQDEITQKIVMTLRLEMEEAEISRIRRIPTKNLNAYEYALLGEEYLRVYSKSTNRQARQMFERAIEMDPGYASPYVGLGYSYLYEWLFYWGQNSQNSKRAFELA